MEKVNIKFHDNGTLTYQHKKILQFVPELSVNKEQKITVPNIPLLVKPAIHFKV
jgi:scavenger receptor class B protein 1